MPWNSGGYIVKVFGYGITYCKLLRFFEQYTPLIMQIYLLSIAIDNAEEGGMTQNVTNEAVCLKK